MHATAPTPVTQREMVGQLAQHLGRPQFLRVPRVALSPLGEFRGLLLDSQRVMPNAAMNRGFKFLYATLNEALQDLLGEFSGARGQAGHVEADQDLPASPAAVWDFLCDPANVAVVTPLSMQAQLRQVPDRIEAGATLKVAVAVAGVALPWELQVTQYSPGESFVESQIHGPF